MNPPQKQAVTPKRDADSKARTPGRTSVRESANPKWVPVGERLRSIRGTRERTEMAERLGISKTTLGRLERGVRELGADLMAKLATEGWNIGWLLTGEGPERVGGAGVGEASAVYGSHQVSAKNLTIALEMADEKLSRDQLWLPRADYAELVLLILQRLQEGWAYPRIRALVEATMARLAQGESDAGRPVGVDGEGEGGSRQG